MFDVPIAVFVYNRPDLTATLMTQLERVKPHTLLVVADGPRDAADSARVAEVKRVVRTAATWTPNVSWLVSEENLGCAGRVETGLDWVFAHVPQALILEDDVEVAPSLFPFVQAALRLYREDSRIGMVTAGNALVDYSPDGRVFASRRGSVGAWATWADRWQTYRSQFGRVSLRPGLTDGPTDSVWFALQRHQLSRGKEAQSDDEWATAWEIWCTAQAWLALVPPRNLVVNRGFRADAAHTTDPQDLRACYPPVHAEPVPTLPDPRELGFDEEYADLATYLDFLVVSAHPRKWRVLAAATRGREDLAPSMRLRLTPWLDPGRSRDLLAHMGRHLRSAHLDELREALG